METVLGCSKQGEKRKRDAKADQISKCEEKNFWTQASTTVCELIFQHLSYEDILNASNVCKQFYKLTGSSKSCMEKIQINVGKNDLNNEDLKISTRKYQNLRLHNYSDDIVEYLSKNSWRKVSLLIGSISDSDCAKLLATFAPAVVEFEFYIENIFSLSTMKPIDFPELDSITFRWTSKKIFEPFAGTKNHKLKTVVIELSKSGCNEAVEGLLKQNKSISNLSIRLTKEDYNDLFTRDISIGLELKLQTLSFYWRHTNYVEPEIIENWKRFFLSQKASLKRLVFECTFDCKSVLETIVNDMTALEHLTFVDLDDETLLSSEQHDFTLQPNLSIKQIDVCVNWFISDEMFEQLIVATPNLEILYLFELSTKIMKFLAKNTRSLKHLIYEEIDGDCEEAYEEMINENLIINRNIKIHWDQDFEVDYPELHEKMQFF